MQVSIQCNVNNFIYQNFKNKFSLSLWSQIPYTLLSRHSPKLFCFFQSLFVHPPSHLQRVEHRSPALEHLQLPLQAMTHPQRVSREHAWLTSGNSVQNGIHICILSFNSHPQPPGLAGISGTGLRTCLQ